MSPILAAGMCLILLFVFLAAVAAEPPAAAPSTAPPASSTAQDLFPPGAVRLLDGPFNPADLVAGKEPVTVRFEAKPGSLAGGLFDLRVVKPE